MNKTALLAALTSALHLSAAAPAQAAPKTDTLSTWLNQYGETIVQKAEALATPPFAWNEVTDLIDVTVKAAQALKGEFAGADRKTIVKTVIKTLVNVYARPYLGLFGFLLSDQVLDSLVEFAWQRLFGAVAA